jgi:hypothetical protein
MNNYKTVNPLHHIEKYLGKFDSSWAEENMKNACNVLGFFNTPIKGVNTYVTAGLNKHILNMPKKRLVREELIISVENNFCSDDIVSFLISFSDFILSKHQALLKGDVIGPYEPIIPNVKTNSIYSTDPFFFDDQFIVLKESSPPTVFVYLMPILESEVKFIHSHGWSQFDNLLEKKMPNIFNLDRLSIV